MSSSCSTTHNAYFPSSGGGKAQIIHSFVILFVPALSLPFVLMQIASGELGSWPIILMLIMWFLTILGVTVGFHRLFSHKAFKTTRFLKVVFAIAGCMACQGGVIYWVSNHRRHHRFSDKEGDPHSPKISGKSLSCFRGFVHSHLTWTFNHDMSNPSVLAKDLLRDKDIRWVNEHYFKWVLISVSAPMFVGFYIGGGLYGAATGFLWGAAFRLFVTYHVTSGINSIAHLWGYRNFKTSESSKNNIFLSLPTLGEGWHNNHHAYPSSAKFGYKWWEVDVGWLIIAFLEKLGLVWGVNRSLRSDLGQKKI